MLSTESRNRFTGAITSVNGTASAWNAKTIILTDSDNNTVTFTFNSGTTTHSRTNSTQYVIGVQNLFGLNDGAHRIAAAINLAGTNGDLAMSAELPGYPSAAVVRINQLRTYGGNTTIGGTGEAHPLFTVLDFGASPESPTDDLYIKPHIVVEPDFTLHHYDLDHVDANYNIDSSIAAAPRQAPFSKRFQIIRALDGNQITTG